MTIVDRPDLDSAHRAPTHRAAALLTALTDPALTGSLPHVCEWRLDAVGPDEPVRIVGQLGHPANADDVAAWAARLDAMVWRTAPAEVVRTARPDHVHVAARARLDGIPVEVWTHIRPTETESEATR